MVWSNWRGAVLVLAAWVVLALCQISAQTPNKTEQFMTVHENGQSTRCKVLGSWMLPAGNKAYQLQSLASGELLTLVEEGQPLSLDASGRTRGKVPMRVFHWGNSRTPPPGSPMPPPELMRQFGQGVPAAPQVLKTDVPLRMPMPVVRNDTSSRPAAPTVVSGNRAKDTIIWWEEGHGSAAHPQGVIPANGPAPWDNGPAIVPQTVVPQQETGPAVRVVTNIDKPGPSFSPATTATTQRSRMSEPQVVTVPQADPAIITPMPMPAASPAISRASRFVATSPVIESAESVEAVPVVVPSGCDSTSRYGRSRPLYTPARRMTADTGVIVTAPGAQVVHAPETPAGKVIVQSDPSVPAGQVMSQGLHGGVGTSVGPMTPIFGNFAGRQHRLFARSSPVVEANGVTHTANAPVVVPPMPPMRPTSPMPTFAETKTSPMIPSRPSVVHLDNSNFKVPVPTTKVTPAPVTRVQGTVGMPQRTIDSKAPVQVAQAPIQVETLPPGIKTIPSVPPEMVRPQPPAPQRPWFKNAATTPATNTPATMNNGPVLAPIQQATPADPRDRLQMVQGTPGFTPRTIQAQENNKPSPMTPPPAALAAQTKQPTAKKAPTSTSVPASKNAPPQPSFFARMFGRSTPAKVEPTKTPAPSMQVAQNPFKSAPDRKTATAPTLPAAKTSPQVAANTLPKADLTKPASTPAPAQPNTAKSPLLPTTKVAQGPSPAQPKSIIQTPAPKTTAPATAANSAQKPAASSVASTKSPAATTTAKTQDTKTQSFKNNPNAKVPTTAEMAASTKKPEATKTAQASKQGIFPFLFGQKDAAKETKTAQGPTSPAPKSIQDTKPATRTTTAAKTTPAKTTPATTVAQTKVGTPTVVGESAPFSTAQSSTDTKTVTSLKVSETPRTGAKQDYTGIGASILSPRPSAAPTQVAQAPPRQFEFPSPPVVPGESWSLDRKADPRKVAESIAKKVEDAKSSPGGIASAAARTTGNPGTPGYLPPPDTSKNSPSKSTTKATVAQASQQPETRVPFTTATPGDGTNNLPSIVRDAPPRTVVEAKAPPAAPADSSKLETPKEPVKSVVQAPPPKRDWRNMWGKSSTAQANTQPPGQALEQAPTAKKNDAGGSGIVQTGFNLPMATTPPTSDPLLSPESFDRIAAARPNGAAVFGPAPKSAGGLQQVGFTQPNTASKYASPPQMAANGGRLPPGAGSVVAANNGLMTPVAYVPVPVMTVPDPIRPPSPPAPQVPEPPQPAMYVNAFTPPQQPNAQANGPTQNPRMAVNPAVMAQAYAQNPYLSNPAMLNQGIQRFAYLSPPEQGMIQQALFFQQQTFMLQQQAMFLQQQQAMMQRNMGYPANYQGPQPPNPMSAAPMHPGVAQVGYNQPAAAPNPYAAAPAPYAAGGQQQTMSVQQLVNVLVESPYPAQREWAAGALATYNWRNNPQILHVLVQAARQDPAPTVRAGCIYSLSRMNAASEPVMTTLQSLQNDPDPRVRHEVQQAYVRLGAQPQGN